MLLIGDIVINEINPKHKVKNLEIMYNGINQKNYIVSKLKLKKGRYVNKYTDEYEKNKIKYSLHNVDRNEGLRSILVNTFSNNSNFKTAPLIIEYAIRYKKINTLYKNQNVWFDNLKCFLTLRDKVSNSVIKLPSIGKDLPYIGKLYAPCIEESTSIIKGSYSPYKYDIYSRKDLLDIITNEYLSLYQILTFSPSLVNIHKQKFNNYLYEEQIEAIREKLKLDVINNYVLRNKNPLNFDSITIKQLFDKSIMNLINDETYMKRNNFIKSFIVNNYNKILENFSPYFYYKFKKALTNGYLKKI